ncbi:MAG TPA: hypothetical protein PKI35_06145, partial [Bacteroidales bacterium]|nr:hypothetical protein [Bacteroidales bacterium]
METGEVKGQKFTCLGEVVGKMAGLPAWMRLWVRRQGKGQRAKGKGHGAGSITEDGELYLPCARLRVAGRGGRRTE